ncbi:MAG: hypothetical protein AAGP08_03065 [Pseudomonadota bacterium]
MKRLATLAALLPATAFAHGAHAPVPETAHGAAHSTPVLAGLLVAFAVGLALIKRWRP